MMVSISFSEKMCSREPKTELVDGLCRRSMACRRVDLLAQDDDVNVGGGAENDDVIMTVVLAVRTTRKTRKRRVVASTKDVMICIALLMI